MTGRYFADCKAPSSSASCYDTVAADRLWPASADLVGLTAPRPG